MADDAPSFLDTARGIVMGPASRRQPSAFRTLFTTEDSYDAHVAGLDGPAAPGASPDGFAVHFDGRGSVPSLVLNGSDGEITITGWAAIDQLAQAAVVAAAMAKRMEGIA